MFFFVFENVCDDDNSRAVMVRLRLGWPGLPGFVGGLPLL